MRLLRAAGFPVASPTTDDVNLVTGGMDRLVGEAIRFLRVGTLSLADWVDLTAVERDAFQEAAEVVLAERASVHGAAAQSAEAALAVGARSDGGGGLADALLKTAVAGLARAEPSAPPVRAEVP